MCPQHQGDVLESEYVKLLAKMEESSDFEEVVRAHEVYLAAISTLCFLSVPTIVRVLDQACHTFRFWLQGCLGAREGRKGGREGLGELTTVSVCLARI